MREQLNKILGDKKQPIGKTLQKIKETQQQTAPSPEKKFAKPADKSISASMKFQDSDEDDSSGDEFIKMTAAKAGLKLDSVLKSMDSATRPLAS